MTNFYNAFVCTLLLSIGAAPAVMAKTVSIDAISQQLDDKQQEIKYLEQEIAFAQVRRKSSQDKLKSYEKDLEEKQDDLKAAQQRYSKSPTVENENFLRNAEQRIRLSELSIKSRVASVVRLETKTTELNEQLAKCREEEIQLTANVSGLQLAKKVDQKTKSLQTELESQTNILKQRLETLQRENDRLRQVALAETEKREQAEERATDAIERARAAELALTQYLPAEPAAIDGSENVDAGDENLGAKERAQAEMERVRGKLAESSDNAGSGVSLYLKGDDGTDYGMFQYLGAQQYRADAVIHDAVSRFKVAGRLYQVKISENGLGEEFVFLYDMTDSSKPRFVTFKKSLLSEGGAVAKE